MTSAYPHPCSAPDLGFTTLKTAFLMGSMHVGLKKLPTVLSAWPPSTPSAPKAASG